MCSSGTLKDFKILPKPVFLKKFNIQKSGDFYVF